MEVLIVSKTHMTSAACVGGLVISNNRYVRLLNPGNYNQPSNTDFNIGDVWDIDFANRTPLHSPHIEDVIISGRRYVRYISDIPGFLRQRRIIDWSGSIDNLFDGLLNWTNAGTGFIPEGGRMPSRSVGFWLTDKNLIRVSFENKTRYRYPNGSIYRNISYVGYQDTIETIPSGTIIRVSLSRIFPPQGSTINTPRGYYLQLSGWYIGEINKLAHPAPPPPPPPGGDYSWDLPF